MHYVVSCTENEMLVPALLSAEHLIDPQCDEHSLMTYLSGFRLYFYKNESEIVKRLGIRLHILAWINLVVCLILSSQHNIISQIPQKKVTNLTSDWSNATALAALIEVLCPGSLTTTKETPFLLAQDCLLCAGLWIRY